MVEELDEKRPLRSMAPACRQSEAEVEGEWGDVEAEGEVQREDRRGEEPI